MKAIKWFLSNIYKNSVIILLTALSIFLLTRTLKHKPVDYSRYEYKLDSVVRINKAITLQIDSLKQKVNAPNIEQDKYTHTADSISQILLLKNLHDKEIIVLQAKEIVALRGAIKECNKVKAIQVVTIKKYDALAVNNESLIVMNTKLTKVSKKAVRKAKFKAFMTGTAVGAIVTVVVIIIII